MPLVTAPREKTRFAATVVAGSSAGPIAAQTSAAAQTPRPVSPIPPMAPMVGGPALNNETPVRQSRPGPSAGIDSSAIDPATPVGDWAHVDQPPAAVTNHPDARYSSGVLDLPAATSIPAVLGAGEQDR